MAQISSPILYKPRASAETIDMTVSALPLSLPLFTAIVQPIL